MTATSRSRLISAPWHRHAGALALVALTLSTGASRADAGAAASGQPAASRAVVRDAQAAPSICTKHAAPWGSDGAPATFARPVRTAQRLANVLRPGETGCLRGGTYSDTFDGWVLRVRRGGSAGRRLTIRSYPGERARLVGTVYVPEGSDFVTLSRLRIEGTGPENTIKVYATGTILERSEITNVGRGDSCLILGSASGHGEAIRVVIRRNRFHDCGSVEHDNKDHAIYVSSASGTRIVGNVFWRTSGYAIHLYPNARNSWVSHNIVDGGLPSVRGGVLFGGDDDYASSGNVVERNVIAFSRTYNITSGWERDAGRGNVARSNCLWAGKDGNIDPEDGGFEPHANLVAPPMFFDRDERDYRLRARSRCLPLLGVEAAARLGLTG